MKSAFARYKREVSVAASYLVLLILVAIAAPSFLQTANLRDLAMNNAAVLIVAVGMTLVILTGEIDISIGSQCAIQGGCYANSGVAHCRDCGRSHGCSRRGICRLAQNAVNRCYARLDGGMA